jgi:tRNA (mo5U34)-methyltransferase
MAAKHLLRQLVPAPLGRTVRSARQQWRKSRFDKLPPFNGSPFFARRFRQLVVSPNGAAVWWHNLPLPDGRRIDGVPPDKDLQLKMWDALQIAPDALAGKFVLDIGANDGFFTVAACLSGAAHVTAINSRDWVTWPHNMQFATDAWQVRPEIITSDFRTYPFDRKYDVILLLGVIYHVEDVFRCVSLLHSLLKPAGSLYIETHVSKIPTSLPIFEYASDIHATSAPQGCESLKCVGISNYLFPNILAMENLARSYDFRFVHLNGPANFYSRENPHRQVFRFDKKLSARVAQLE